MNLCDQLCKFIFMWIFLTILSHATGIHEEGVNERVGEGFLEEVTFELGIEALIGVCCMGKGHCGHA